MQTFKETNVKFVRCMLECLCTLLGDNKLRKTVGIALIFHLDASFSFTLQKP